jgi:hypothetical protein
VAQGAEIVTANRIREEGPVRDFIDRLDSGDCPAQRVPGTAVFLNANPKTTPLALRANVEHNHVLHEARDHHLHQRRANSSHRQGPIGSPPMSSAIRTTASSGSSPGSAFTTGQTSPPRCAWRPSRNCSRAMPTWSGSPTSSRR